MKTIIRKMLSVVFVTLLILMQNTSALANSTGESGLYKYTMHESTDASGVTSFWVEITGHTQYVSGELIIPDLINGKPVTQIGPNAFAGQGITSLSIPSGVSVIGESAFADCYSIKNVIFRDGYSGYYLNIKENAFRGCFGMKSITLPVKQGFRIREMAFSACSALTDIYFNGTKEQYDACSIIVYDYNTSFNSAEVFYVDSVRNISLNKTTLSLIAGNSEKLIPTITPSNATNQTILWSSSDESVAVVSANGTVKGVRAGTTTITAKTEDKNRVADCIVTVTESVNEEVLGGGNGTEQNPYRIDSVEKLQMVSDIPNAHYRLETDIILTEKHRPLCNQDNEFTGTFDGNNHTISNVVITDFYNSSGLFGNSSGTIKNLNVIYSSVGVNYSFTKDALFGGIVGDNDGNIINCRVNLNGNIKEYYSSGYTTRVGGIAGKNGKNGNIKNCSVNGAITVTVNSDSDDVRSLYLGGISGINLGTIDSCNTSLSITQNVTVDGYFSVDSCIGGISGSTSGAIKNSKATFNIIVGNTSRVYIGGITGIGSDCTIEKVSTNGNIKATANYVYAGGIIGNDLSSGKISISKANANIAIESSNIFGASYIGGAVGYLKPSSSIAESCAVIDLDVTKSTEYVARPVLHCGGLVGVTNGQINNCYATGSITSNLTTTSVYSGGLVGGISGAYPKISNSYAAVSGVKYGLTYPGGTVTNSFYDGTVSGCSDTGYGVSKTTQGMKMKTIYTNAGWDFNNVWDISSSTNGGYPYLRTTGMPTIQASEVLLSKNSITANVGDSIKLTATVIPHNVTNRMVLWSSSDTSVATVTNGVVSIVGAGTVDIVVRTADGACTNRCTIVVKAPELPKVSAPISNVSSGIIKSGTKVALSTETQDATIYYTIDGSTPTTSSIKYTNEFAINTDTVVKAIAVKSGMSNSSVATFTYTISDEFSWFIEDDVLFIMGTGVIDDYEITSDIPWYSQRLKIREIIICEGITAIGEKAFYGCINATLIEIPESVISIGENAFKNCDEISINGEKDSYAHQYAIANNIPFVRYTEPLSDLMVEFAETPSRWYFDIANGTYAQDAVIYVGIYDVNNKLLAIQSEIMVKNDITSIAILKVDNYNYAKVFEWVDEEPITNFKLLSLK